MVEEKNTLLRLPGETVRSVLGRHSLRTATPAKEILYSISNRKKVRLHPALPCFLGGLQRLGLGRSETFSSHHTLFPLYACFMEEARSKELRTAMLDAWPPKVAQHAGWSANQLRVSHVEKYCPECARSDIELFGVSYWHREHQIPTVSACWKHGAALSAVPLPVSGWDQFHQIRSDQLCHPASPNDIGFARFVSNLLHQLTGKLRAVELGQLYRGQLARQGLLTAQGCVRRQLLAKKMAPFIVEHASDIETRRLPKLRNYCELLYPRRCYRQHLITHLLFSYTFFEHPQQLFEECMAEPPALTPERETINTEKYQEHLASGQSMNRVSALTGRSRTYLKRLAKLHNLPIKEYPRILTPGRRKMITDLARTGQPVDNIAELTGISLSLVQSVVGATPGLKEKRYELEFSKKRKHYRIALRSFLGKHPNCIRSLFQRTEPNSYYWLYRNDKKWLFATLPPSKKPKPPARVDWRKRDSETCAYLTKRLLTGWEPETWSGVDVECGGHGWVLKHRARLPNTVNLLRTACRGGSFN